MAYSENVYGDDPQSEVPEVDEVTQPTLAVWTIGSFGASANDGAIVVVDGISYTYRDEVDLDDYDLDAADPYQSLTDAINGNGNPDAHPNCTAELTDTEEVTITATVGRPFSITSEDEDISDSLNEQTEGTTGTPGQVGDMLLVGEDLYIRTESEWKLVGGSGGGFDGTFTAEGTNIDTVLDLSQDSEDQVEFLRVSNANDPSAFVAFRHEIDANEINLFSTDGSSTVELRMFAGEIAGFTAQIDQLGYSAEVQTTAGAAALSAAGPSSRAANVIVNAGGSPGGGSVDLAVTDATPIITEARASVTLRGFKQPYTAVASAATITPYGNVFHVSGTTNIDNITNAAGPTGQRGIQITMIFDDVLTVNDGTGNLVLAGNFVTSAGSTLVVVSDGVSWYEISRSAN